MGFMAYSHTRKKQGLEPCIRQTQTYPYISLPLEFSRAKCPLGDLSLPRHAMFPWGFPLAVRRVDWRAVVRRGSLSRF